MTNLSSRIYSAKCEKETVKDILGTATLPDGTTIIEIGTELFDRRYFEKGQISPSWDFAMDYQQVYLITVY